MISRLWILVCAFAVAACGQPDAVTDRALVETLSATDRLAARAAIAEFADNLRTELQAGIAEAPDVAVQICHERAGSIATELGRQHGVEIGRTALKVRNPANAPDDWQRATLEHFELAIANGEAPDTLSAYTRSAVGQHRYMQPIMTEPVCALCHGEVIDPQLERTIARLYPTDRARGFEPGDLRGAFIVEW